MKENTTQEMPINHRQNVHLWRSSDM